jgi:hypothetical protein
MLKYFFKSCLIAITACWFIEAPVLSYTSDYEGTLGNEPIGLTLYTDHPKKLSAYGTVCGYYFSIKSLKDIPLQIARDADGKPILYALDANHKRISRFNFSFPSIDPKRKVKGGCHRTDTWDFFDGDALNRILILTQQSNGKDKHFAIVEGFRV